MADIHQLETDLAAVEEKIGRLYRERAPILEALAEARGPAELPPRRYRTEKQQLIARCPRCSGRLVSPGDER